jgi:hypothetical protein
VASGLAAQEPVSVPAGASVDAAAWLAGCWMARDGGRRTEEIWMAPAGGVMVGMGRVVRSGRPASWEHLVLREREGALTYTALPSGQSLTHFPLVAVEPGRLRFENPAHDSPRALEYRRPTADSLRVHVFAAVEDPEPAFTVRFAREPCPP